MYMTNLPDDVLIPDALLRHVEGGALGEQAKLDALAWVRECQDADEGLKKFWVRKFSTSVSSCERYGAPECADFFGYVRELMERYW